MKNKVLTEQKIKYIQDRIPSIARNIHEGNFFKKAGLFARELGYRTLGAMERQNMERRVGSSLENSRNAQRIADIQLSNAGFNVPNVRDIQATAPTTQPVLPRNANRSQREQHDAQMELWRQRQGLERQLAAARQTNPGLRRSEQDVTNVRGNFARNQQKSSTLIDPAGSDFSHLESSDIERLLPHTPSYKRRADMLRTIRKRLP
jgi:hypothetical protein